MATRHRSDICFADLTLLACFAHALDRVFIHSFSPVFELGEYDMLLPLWFQGGGDWKLSTYRIFKQQAIGLSHNGMVQVCRDYMKVPMVQVLNLLYKLSMLSVIDGTQVDDKPRFRQPFSGIPREYIDWDDADSMRKHVRQGFIIEKRRAVGGFR